MTDWWLIDDFFLWLIDDWLMTDWWLMEWPYHSFDCVLLYWIVQLDFKILLKEFGTDCLVIFVCHDVNMYLLDPKERGGGVPNTLLMTKFKCWGILRHCGITIADYLEASSKLVGNLFGSVVWLKPSVFASVGWQKAKCWKVSSLVLSA